MKYTYLILRTAFYVTFFALIANTLTAQTPTKKYPWIIDKPDSQTQSGGSATYGTTSTGTTHSTTTYGTTNSGVAYYDPYNAVTHIPTYTDAEYRQKMYSLAFDVPVVYNSQVRAFIELYTIKKRDVAQRVLGRTDIYFPIIERIFFEKGIPTDLKYLAVAESALNPNAVSRAGATGLWQLMSGTAKENYLIVNSYVDERRDPYRSTEAAARYLKKLYNKYGDWLLVVAAYNCGPGKVNRAIRLSGSRDFWTMRKYLPRETRGHVPAFLSCLYWANFANDHNLYAMPEVYPDALDGSDTVLVREKIHLEAIANILHIDLEELKYLNPALRRQIIPQSNIPYTLRLPIIDKWSFVHNKPAILAYMQQPEMSQKVQYAQVHATRSGRAGYAKNSFVVPPGKTEIWYTVKSGDNLGYIADWYDCRVSELKLWNNLRGTRLQINQRLRVLKNDAQASRYKSVNGKSFEQKQGIAASGQGAQNPPTLNTQPEAASNKGNLQPYTIKKGDSLWLIAKQNPGNSIEKLLKINGLTAKSKLQPGMIINILR